MAADAMCETGQGESQEDRGWDWLPSGGCLPGTPEVTPGAGLRDVLGYVVPILPKELTTPGRVEEREHGREQRDDAHACQDAEHDEHQRLESEADREGEVVERQQG